MSLVDTITRIDFICKKYDGYVREAQSEEKATSKDSFTELYDAIDKEIDNMLQRSAEVALEGNRATVAALNAEIRRGKDIIIAEMARLEKLSVRKVRGVSETEMQSRPGKVEELWSKVKTLPDAINIRPKKSAVQPYRNNFLDMAEAGELGKSGDYYKPTEESASLRSEYVKRAKLQDEQLDFISSGLERLKHIAEDMAEELDNQDPVLDQMETKMEAAVAKLKTNNRRMNELIFEARSTNKFCLDVLIIVILLGIGCYLYTIFK